MGLRNRCQPSSDIPNGALWARQDAEKAASIPPAPTDRLNAPGYTPSQLMAMYGLSLEDAMNLRA